MTYGERVGSRVSIQQVAERAGVSTTTVSHALNGKGRLADATRERVRAAAEELGYQPHGPARNLAGGKSGILGLAVSQTAPVQFAVTDFAYFIQLMGAATQTAFDRGYALVLVPPGSHATASFAALNLDGAVVVDPLASDPLVSHLRAGGIPVVTAGRVPDEPDQEWWVDNDHAAGTLATLQHLERQGARRIALVTSPPLTSYTIDTLAAYERWCAASGVQPQVATTAGDLTESAGFAAANELLNSESPPDAIYATLDRLALGVLLAAQANGASVPRDLLVAGCTDSDVVKRSHPALTALSLNPEEIGRQAVRMLTELIDGHTPAERQIRVGTRVVPRASTKRPKAGAAPQSSGAAASPSAA